ncbi:MAG: PKD domain-containing protein, partial [Nitrospiraceae bacterium]
TLPFEVMHTYPGAGGFDWTLTVVDNTSALGVTGGTIVVDGPVVNLKSEPFPPLVVLENGSAVVDFTATVNGGVAPYIYTWDFESDGTADLEDGEGVASFAYTVPGKYQASVKVTDDCGLMGQDTLPVVILDPDQEACHPMAQRIADGVNTLFPGQAADLYTCEDIFNIFRGGLTGSQVGFGRLWHAYKLAQTIQDLTWEEIRDWHLDGNGWGGLVQLNRFANILEQHGIRELVELVLAGEASVKDIRHAVRSVSRHEADFNDALSRLGDGMSPGELGRFYRIAEALHLDPGQLDDYLSEGLSLQELKHAARVAERTNSAWAEVAEAHAAGHSWGAIGQAQRLSEDGDWISILETGVRETRKQMRDEDRSDREQERIDRTAEQLAKHFGASEGDVLNLYRGMCAQDWKCVRKELRGQPKSGD